MRSGLILIGLALFLCSLSGCQKLAFSTTTKEDQVYTIDGPSSEQQVSATAAVIPDAKDKDKYKDAEIELILFLADDKKVIASGKGKGSVTVNGKVPAKKQFRVQISTNPLGVPVKLDVKGE